VDTQQQLPFASVLLVQTCLLVTGLGVFAYLVNRRMMSLILDLLGHDQVRLSQEIYEALQALVGSYIAAIGFTALVQILFGIYMSHKLAGPVRKMTGVLTELAAERPSQRVVFRKGDYLDELADVLNRFLAQLDHRRGRLREELPFVAGALNELKTGIDQGQLPANSQQLQKAAASLDALIEAWPGEQSGQPEAAS
jgi:methyl-accepting chemotaxis protein